ncbi:ubiquinol-cytochrome C reductase, partial [Xanthomonas citri pv. citri]|nr:ubiquinol-cytochrome C reductase [Xanthomonas citri pv. citri]
FFIGYFGVGQIGNGEPFSKIYLQNLLLGLGTALAMFGIGIGVVHWARTLMPDHETIEDRHEIRSEDDRVAAERMISEILDESQI